MDKFIVCHSLNGIKERKLNNAYITFHMTLLYITTVDRQLRAPYPALAILLAFHSTKKKPSVPLNEEITC